MFHIKRNSQSIQKINQTIRSQLLEKLDHFHDDDTIRVIIRVHEQSRISAKAKPEKNLQILKDTARKSQKPVIDYLSKGLNTRIHNLCKYKGFWLVNLVSAQLTRDEIVDLATLPEVEQIYQDITVRIPENQAKTFNQSKWDNIGMVNAPQVWAQGYYGQQIKVAVLDTGVDIEHPELQGAMGGEPPYHEGYWVEINEDGEPIANSKPHDSDFHGTHVSGTVLGRNVNMRIGMAPQAILGHALILPQGGGTMAQVLGGMQWAIEQGFHIVNGSWGIDDLIPDLLEAINNMAAAGIFPAFAIGNSGMEYTCAPGNTPLAEAVGAFGPAGEVAEFSGGGVTIYPNYFYADNNEQIKPDISAPGVDITSAIPGGKYSTHDGTSMATPHVAGAVALLLSKNPTLTVEELKTILHQSVGGQIGMLSDPGRKGKDTRYGWGRLNVLQSLQHVKEAEPIGLLEGYVQGENEFIANAQIVCTGPQEKILSTDYHGFFHGSFKEGSYTLTVIAEGYDSQVREVKIVIDENTIKNVILDKLLVENLPEDEPEDMCMRFDSPTPEIKDKIYDITEQLPETPKED